MSDPTPPGLPPEVENDAKAAVLRQRTWIFVAAFGSMIILYLTLLPFYSTPDPSEPNIFMWLIVVAMLIELPILAFVIFDPQRMRKNLARSKLNRRSSSLVATLQMAIFIAASVSVTPALFGLIVFFMSNDAWRAFIFLPVSLATAFALWNRLSHVIDAWADSEFT